MKEAMLIIGKRIVFILLFLCMIGFTSKGFASGTFISAPGRTDMVHDPVRNVLYISSGGELLRYDLNSRQFLLPFQLGGTLKGMDLSPDSNTLAVADTSYADNQNWIYLIDLQTGNSQKITFPLGTYEGGTYTVAYGNNGDILVTSTFNGSGWVPLRKYSPTTGTTTIIRPSITQNTMLSAGADGNIIGFAESNISDGRWGRYRVSDGDFVERLGYTNGTSWYNYEIGTNRNGTQFAIPTYGGTFIYDSTFAKIATIGEYAGPQPIGVVYNPIDDIVYFPWVDTTEVRAYDTTTFTQIGSYDFEYTFQNNGNWAFQNGRMKISRDGTLLFATVEGGIRYVQLNGENPPVAIDQSVETEEDTPISITLQAEAPGGETLTYHIQTPPQHGTLSGDAPNLVYTPVADYNGSDSFSFNASIGDLVSDNATVAINIVPVNDPPVAGNDTAYTQIGKPVIINALANDRDADGDKLTITHVSQPRYGVVNIQQDGTLRYLPRHILPNRLLMDVFNYSISDGNGGTATAKITVYIMGKSLKLKQITP